RIGKKNLLVLALVLSGLDDHFAPVNQLKVTFNDKTRLRWQGSNAYPPHLEDLLEVFMKHGLFGDETISL
ncbi:MAG: hypothetical protein HGA54_04095, partial [Actinobacteria bacterium]|nr:hypothetical protein [Actinomycetota bacterium]